MFICCVGGFLKLVLRWIFQKTGTRIKFSKIPDLILEGSGLDKGQNRKMVRFRYKFQGICNFWHTFRIRSQIFRCLKRRLNLEKPVILIELRYCNAHISVAWRVGHEFKIKLTGIFWKTGKILKTGNFDRVELL